MTGTYPEPNTSARKPTRASILWIFGAAIFCTFLVWLTLWQIKSIAEDNVPTPAEHAQCLAELDPTTQTDLEEACPTEPDVIYAARHPVRNSIIIFALLVIGGFAYRAFHYSTHGDIFGKTHPG